MSFIIYIYVFVLKEIVDEEIFIFFVIDLVMYMNRYMFIYIGVYFIYELLILYINMIVGDSVGVLVY